MIELSNQECRDLPGSLSDRGCYFDKDGKPTVERKKAESFSCVSCSKSLPIQRAFHVKEEVKGKKALRPICAACSIIREGQ